MSGTSTGVASSGGAGSDSNSGNFYQGDGGRGGKKKKKKETSADQEAIKKKKKKRQDLERKIMGAGIWTNLYNAVTNHQKVEETKQQINSYVKFSSKKETVHINA